MATCSWDRSIKVWNVSNPTNWFLIRTYKGHTCPIYAIEHINIDTIASGANHYTIKIWSIASGQTKRVIRTASNVISLKLLHGFYLASGLQNGNITIYDLQNYTSLSTLIGHKSYVNDFELISDDLLASSSQDFTIRLWNLTTNKVKFVLQATNSPVHGLKLNSLTGVLACGSSDATIKLWNVTNGIFIRTLSNHTSTVYRAVDFYCTQTLISGSYDRTFKIWNSNTGELKHSFNTSLKISALAILNSCTLLRLSLLNVYFG